MRILDQGFLWQQCEPINGFKSTWFHIFCFRDDHCDRFQLYLDKTFNKTASLMANSCKAVAILANQGRDHPHLEDMAFKYGQNIGIAFQLVDDLLDFVASADMLG